MIAPGGGVRSQLFGSKNFDRTFASVAVQNSAILLDEFEKIRTVQEICDGLLSALCVSALVSIVHSGEDFIRLDWYLIIIISLLLALVLMLPHMALIAFDKKLAIFLDIIRESEK